MGVSAPGFNFSATWSVLGEEWRPHPKCRLLHWLTANGGGGATAATRHRHQRWIQQKEGCTRPSWNFPHLQCKGKKQELDTMSTSYHRRTKRPRATVCSAGGYIHEIIDWPCSLEGIWRNMEEFVRAWTMNSGWYSSQSNGVNIRFVGYSLWVKELLLLL